MIRGLKLLSVTLAFITASIFVVEAADVTSTSTMIEKRNFDPTLADKWIGNGISYSPYRTGQSPDMQGLVPREHILQDLQILSQRWNLIRLYGADAQHQQILQVIRDNQLPIRVMQGAWISSHQTKQQNDEQIDRVITMANEFPEIIVAVNVGNEIFVDWSWHKIEDMDGVIAYIRKVRSAVTQPVTVNDDYNFWNKQHSSRIASEIDFIGLHAYAFWNNIKLEDALKWSQSIYQYIQKRYPTYVIAMTETGWPTSRVYDDSYEGTLIGKAGEDEQRLFFEQYNEWINKDRITSFYFSAFDEQWKGGFDGENPLAKAEKHWGVYKWDRTPKKLLQ